ncbi:polysaccharide biosynthesis/export family protein [Arthrospiribacter ruber]|uniref:Sugar transporter n=1 Tax=Arthrospiribacter ruber TaxID=2487934 RepID=A0A951IUN4_9BACT|nr:polysaccharide biosynthesis/export family protein [Arthrospiribacter ruber]MBW3466396.1 sugar transporter [Arthrospiribacter ruber]
MNRFSYLLGLFLMGMSAASCVSNKRIIYLQNLEGNEAIAEDVMINYELPEYKLQFNDIIDVDVKTAEDMIQSGFNAKFQDGANRMVGQIAQTGGDIYYMTGYSVDKKGNIRLPIIGELNVMNKTLEETREVIEEKLREYVTTELYVRVKLGGIRFSTLGEFRRPGKHVVLQDRMTIFEAIAQAGDLTPVAKRDEVLIIRQYPEGSKLHRVNLNDRQLVRSPFYFIQPNDQIYVEPLKVRELGAGENAAQSIALVISSVTAIALVLNLVTR